MVISHVVASGMGGIRGAGDLVAWMQLTRNMKINEAKQYVAEKLGVPVLTLCDEDAMRQIRQDLDIGTVSSAADAAKGILAKRRIAELLDVNINSVNKFMSKFNAPLKKV